MIVLLSAVMAGAFRAGAQNVFEQTVSFDKVIHDFGDIMIAGHP